MNLNLISGHDEDGNPVNGLVIGWTVADIHEVIEQMHAGADVVELPMIHLDGLMEGTATDGRVSFIRNWAGRDEEAITAALMEVLADDNDDEPLVYIEHGDVADGIGSEWRSPLLDATDDLAAMDSPDFWERFAKGGDS